MSLQERHERISEDCIGALKCLRDLITKNMTDVEKGETIPLLEELTKEFISLHDSSEASETSLGKLDDYLSSDAIKDVDLNTINIDELYRNGIEKVKHPFQKSEIWVKVFGDAEDIEEVAETRESMCTTFEEVNDSVLCSNAFQPPVDPLTKKLITNPCKNAKCGHIYEHQTILKYIQSMKRKAKCPFVGCINRQLLEADLRIDDDMKQKIMEYNSS